MSLLIFERSVPESNTFSLPPLEVESTPLSQVIPESYLREQVPDLPELSEVETVRHFTDLSHQAYGVDDGLYPLGSCTMKYNPKISEWAARLPGFAQVHPYQPAETVQGWLELLYETEQMLAEIGGMTRFSLQPAAGAHGELAGIMIMKAYHNQRQDFKRTKILVPDSAHGTNPATGNMLGYTVIELASNDQGLVDLAELRKHMSDEVAGLMLTNPNTLGLFETDIAEIAEIVHAGGGLLYYDGANLNGIMGMTRPGDMGFDIVHYNLHKTFATPHGGGGPGSGPVGVKDFLVDYLPIPRIDRQVSDNSDKGGTKNSGAHPENPTFYLNYDLPQSIGKVRSFYGNAGVIVKAYTYLRALGGSGIKDACQQAVLNANYLRHHLSRDYHVPFNRLCKHEVVITSKLQMDAQHVSTTDIAKRLIDYGYHPPTVYFPLIVREAMMFEPVETESQGNLDAIIQVMHQIAQESRENPDLVKNAPQMATIKRVDEVTAARKPIVKWSKEEA